MLLENIGLGVSAIGSVLGVLLIIVGGFFYLFEKDNKFTIARAVRSFGTGVVLITFSIPFTIPNHLLTISALGETSIAGAIIISAFLGAPLLFMGLTCYIGLNEKAHTLLQDGEVVVLFSNEKLAGMLKV